MVPSIVDLEHKPVSVSLDTHTNNDPNFERKLDTITAGALPHVKQHLLTKISRVNCKVIVDYILALQVEVGLVSPTGKHHSCSETLCGIPQA